MDHGSDLSGYINSVIEGNAIEVLPAIPSSSVDIVFADPPYNLQLGGELWRPDQTKVDAVNDEWDKFESFEEYDRFSVKWLSECRRILKPDGTIWVIGTYHNIFRIGKIMQDTGYWIINDVVWIKTNPMPNFKGTRFTNAHETLIFAARSRDSRYRFNYRSMKAFNCGLQMRSDWEIPICSGKERIRVNGKKVHSTQKPVELLRRVLLSSSSAGDTLLDPFAGTGTSLAVAKALGRNYIGIESSRDYVRITRDRLSNIEVLSEQLLHQPVERREKRIPFGSIVSCGLLPAGTVVYSQDRSLSATVYPDGSLVSGNTVGSIHRLGAILTGKHECNGWTFWHFEQEGGLIPISELRERYRSFTVDGSE
ncbi:MAG: site-specific DNA-methyltransferase [Thermoplasmata archaeon]|uniref:Type II methyltransferase n=1 Tax=Candidatus Sysuiplasma superficiale TaxID=2823368 RepID=A0A8J8CES8_9ARCH|nr:site-specific DNA-methyltransferase [Candidatus Sysuiplasma superficiale]MBX8644533.1 site-specific DNA-methyltransferase [Candidatus Sysuiplasma superficiale]MCL4346919.1 site-specific DNA-methyltransferase [Candidatus Thermoplasmatota archaeon]